jgi:hypothetical protein
MSQEDLGYRVGQEDRDRFLSVRIVRRTRNPADLCASGGLTQLVSPVPLAKAEDFGKGPFLIGN